MSEQTTVLHPVAISQVMVNFAARQGIAADRCLQGTGISTAELHDPDALIERAREMRLIENLIHALPHVSVLGFEVGLQYSISTFGIWGFAMRINRTLREAILCALRYLPLSTAYCRFQLLPDDLQTFGLRIDPDAIPAHLRTFLLQRDTATAINLIRELGLAGVDVQRLEFAGPAPVGAERIASLCGLVPHFGCTYNAIVMRRRDVELPLPMYDANLASFLDAQCRQQLERRQMTGVTGQVRQLVLGPLGLIASIEDVAEHMAMATRTLRRKLEDEGISYRNILDEERRQLAAQLLATTDIKLDVLALQLGYGDTPSFARAFRRWFGEAPGEYRRRRTS